MKARTDYKICPECGAALDVGEVCDCKKEKKARRLDGCMFIMTHSCVGCGYNSEPQASVGNCTILNNTL